MMHSEHRYLIIFLISGVALLGLCIYIDIALLDFGVIHTSTRLSAGGTLFLDAHIKYGDFNDSLSFITNYGFSQCDVDRDKFRSADIAFCRKDKYGARTLLQFKFNTDEIDWEMERERSKVTPEIWSQWDHRISQVREVLNERFSDGTQHEDSS